MPKLNQILAIEKGKKTKLHKEITELHHALQKPALVNGHNKVFTPREEGGETFPDDNHRVQYRYKDVFEQISERMAVLMDVVATKDYTNTSARADVLVDGDVFLEGVPVPFLLFLEKELHDLHTFVDKTVELDQGETWTFDENADLFRSEPVKQHRTKKLQRPIVKYEATEHHPAQTELITEDVVIGHWTTTKFSGAIPRPRKKALLDRISTLEDAVKYAREKANAIDADERRVGEKILAYVFKA